MGSFIPLNASAVTITKATLSEQRYVGQKTEMSNPASPTVTPPWQTSTSYKRQSAIDTEHGEPYHATLPNNMTIAISTMTMFSDTPVKVTDTPISTGSLRFTGSALVFHKTSGEPFTVTYTVDAVARTPNH